MKIGTVALIGRPNTGKSTLVNNLVGQKVTITSPKPQTTQFPIFAVYEDEEHQVVFVDTPGIFAKSRGRGSGFNSETEKILATEVDLILYVIDHTRPRGIEENKVLGLLRKVDTPKILVINKTDKKVPSFRSEYRFLEDEVDDVIEISALKEKNLRTLVQKIFTYLHEGEKVTERAEMSVPAIGINSKQYIEEAIREKAFLKLRDELPYALRVVVDEITERDNGVLYIKARILTTEVRYKKMIIGRAANRIKLIGSMTRRDLEISSGKKVFLDLTVDVE